MYVGPFEIDFYAPSGVRELAVVDNGHNIHYLQLLDVVTPINYRQLSHAARHTKINFKWSNIHEDIQRS
jgi:hypothetical protein